MGYGCGLVVMSPYTALAILAGDPKLVPSTNVGQLTTDELQLQVIRALFWPLHTQVHNLK